MGGGRRTEDYCNTSGTTVVLTFDDGDIGVGGIGDAISVCHGQPETSQQIWYHSKASFCACVCFGFLLFSLWG